MDNLLTRDSLIALVHRAVEPLPFARALWEGGSAAFDRADDFSDVDLSLLIHGSPQDAFAAIEPTKRLFAAARRAGIPIFYSTTDSRPESLPGNVTATKRRPGTAPRDASLYAIRPEFKPQPGDVVITKQRASAFFGTPLTAHLNQLGVRSVIMCGESTSGCVRASAVDAFSHGYHVTLVEECCFDRSDISHKVNLFDMHHKYCDVMRIDEVVAHLDGLAVRKAG